MVDNDTGRRVSDRCHFVGFQGLCRPRAAELVSSSVPASKVLASNGRSDLEQLHGPRTPLAVW